MRNLIILALILCAAPIKAQSVPTTIVEFDERTAWSLAIAYPESKNERLFCVTKWETIQKSDYSLIHITEVREEAAATSNDGVVWSMKMCRDAKGAVLPIIHTHPAGSCQPSPYDNEVYIVRMAPFDGILCGPRSHSWSFSKQLLAAVRWQQQMDINKAP